MNRISSPGIVFLLIVFLISLPSRAKAEPGFGDAALTVAVTTVSGAVLGASTLPFYEDSGKHTKNIFYGAALGAVVGVFLAAYAGVQDGDNADFEEEEAFKPDSSSIHLGSKYWLYPETTSAKRALSPFEESATLIWSPVASLKF